MQRNTLILVLLLIVVVGGIFIFRQNTQAPTSPEDSTSVTPAQQTTGVVYEGDLPCADCEGIDVVLSLKQDGTFEQSNTYRGRDIAPYLQKGQWKTIKGDATNPEATVYELVFSEEGTPNQYYLVSGDKLEQLDENKLLIEAPFDTSLTKKAL